MDLNMVGSFEQPKTRDELPALVGGDSWLAGGHLALFRAAAGPDATHRSDRARLDAARDYRHAGLFVAATCKVASLEAFTYPVDWRAGPLISQCCHAFLASFKIWNVATVGGNICMALPAGPMISLATAPRCHMRPVECGRVRASHPRSRFRGRAAEDVNRARRGAARHRDRSRGDAARHGVPPHLADGAGALGRHRDRARAMRGGISASRSRRRRAGRSAWRSPTEPDPAALPALVDAAIPAADYYDDIHGRPDWRRHMTHIFAAEVLAELSGAPA